jgi:hypothetical protein
VHAFPPSQSFVPATPPASFSPAATY